MAAKKKPVQKKAATKKAPAKKAPAKKASAQADAKKKPGRPPKTSSSSAELKEATDKLTQFFNKLRKEFQKLMKP